MTNKVYDIIADKVLEQLEKGIIPWRKPWNVPAGAYPQSINGHRYSGINALLLGLAPYSDTRWATFKEVTKRGGKVQKGEKGTAITFWKQLEVEDNETGKVKKIPLLRYFIVFNVEQCDGLNVTPIPGIDDEVDPILEAEKVIAEMPNSPKMTNGGRQAYYNPSGDLVNIPKKGAFNTVEEYYTTTFHELAHSTGHESRLDRNSSKETPIFGSENYGLEELVAEFAASFISHNVGITSTVDNSASYIAGWIRNIKKDKTIIVNAASKGQKAANYILNVS